MEKLHRERNFSEIKTWSRIYRSQWKISSQRCCFCIRPWCLVLANSWACAWLYVPD